MSWRLSADIREMFVEVVATDGKNTFVARTLNRKDLLLSGLTEALGTLPSDFNKSDALLSLTSDFERVAIRERWGTTAAFITTEGFENLLQMRGQQRSQLFSLHPGNESSLIGS